MSNVNTVAVSGNLTRDPETKWTSDDGDSAIVNLGIAVNRSRKNKESGEWEDEVSFFDIDVYGGFAKLVARKLKKGDSATVQGRLEQQKWEQDGQNRSAVRIVATAIDSEGFFRSKDEDNVVEATTSATPQGAEAATPTDDDIPF